LDEFDRQSGLKIGIEAASAKRFRLIAEVLGAEVPPVAVGGGPEAESLAALPWGDKTRRGLAIQVPLSDVARPIAGLLEFLGDRDFPGRHPHAGGEHAAEMRKAASQKRDPGRRTGGVRRVGAAAQSPLAHKLPEVRSLDSPVFPVRESLPAPPAGSD